MKGRRIDENNPRDFVQILYVNTDDAWNATVRPVYAFAADFKEETTVRQFRLPKKEEK